MKPLISFKNVSYSVVIDNQNEQILKNISFAVYPGEIVSIVGPSNCGKSKIISLISSVIFKTNGELFVNANTIGYMAQIGNLFKWSNVYKGFPMTSYGIGESSYIMPKALPKNSKSKVALINALISEPEILLLDEPFLLFDYESKYQSLDCIYENIKSSKKAAVIITKDISEAVSISDKVIILSNKPATVKNIISINKTLRTYPSNFKSTNEAKQYFNLIYDSL